MEDRGARYADNVLALLFSRIMSKTRMTEVKIEENNRKYVMNPLNRIPKDSSKQSSIRGNIRKEIERSQMTWKVYEKLLRWMNPTSIKFATILTWPDGTVTVEEVKIRVDNYEHSDTLDDQVVSDLTNDELLEVVRARGMDIKVIIPGVNDSNEE